MIDCMVTFYTGVFMHSISPRIRGVAWHPMGWQLDLSIRLNQSLINIYILMYIINKGRPIRYYLMYRVIN